MKGKKKQTRNIKLQQLQLLQPTTEEMKRQIKINKKKKGSTIKLSRQIDYLLQQKQKNIETEKKS